MTTTTGLNLETTWHSYPGRVWRHASRMFWGHASSPRPARGSTFRSAFANVMGIEMFRMSEAINWLDQCLYPAFSDQWDNTLFRQEIRKYLNSSTVLLDLGAGAGILPQMDFRDHCGLACGVDIEPSVLDNPFLHEARVGNIEQLPWAENTFDIVISNNVLEHLSQPATAFSEVYRVLKPGGIFFIKTPNCLHYVALLARCTPHRFHEWFNQKRGRASKDTFPTFYKVNRSGRIRQCCLSAGLLVEDIRHIEGRPEYLRFSVPSYLLGTCYERLVNSTRLLSSFRAVLIAVMRKPMPPRG